MFEQAIVYLENDIDRHRLSNTQNVDKQTRRFSQLD
jgi:hypothetical protein